MKIAIIGGGAAGIMAAAALIEETVGLSAEFKPEIFLFEKNLALGRKVVISGGGRCNVTTGLRDKNLLLKKYIRGADFLRHALAFFSPAKVYDWFESHGVPLKIEDDLRVFPGSNKGTDVVAVFEKMFVASSVRLHLGESVKFVRPVDAKFQLETTKSIYEMDYVVITTGGNAYRHTGSTGDGYDFARECGHTITDLGPSLNSFETVEDWPRKLSGLSLPWVKLEAVLSGVRKQFEGPFLFTHFGVSGPAVFGISAHLAFSKISPQIPLELVLYPMAEMGLKQWDDELRLKFEAQGAAQLHNVLAELLPRRLADEMLALAGLTRDKRVSKISREERITLSKLLAGGLKLHLTNRRPGDEFVTAGGVNTGEVNNKTMQSLKHPGLYLAGEVLDVDGVTGGFNLQASWATGRLAGMSIAKSLTKR